MKMLVVILSILMSLLLPKSLHGSQIDFLIFRQIWPEPTCMFPGSHSCSIPKNIKTWVVHGLWPTKNGEIGPSFCNKSLPFNPDNIKPIISDLEQFWPNLYTDTPLESFWSHEWEKHGTCSLGLLNITKEYDYFHLSLALRSSFDFGIFLNASSIVPDDKRLYTVDAIKNSIKSQLGVSPLPVCFIEKNLDIQYLSQMQICFDKTMRLIECSTDVVELVNVVKDNEPQQTTCLSHLPVSYPTIKPN